LGGYNFLSIMASGTWARRETAAGIAEWGSRGGFNV
jgi:hypothetical protein